ncbi:exodeoxyribonuclease VII large subunit, partial [Escherichia coli]|nr:exodeoxyribonuclease VII large subunit [Escherichia coli]
RIVPDLHEEFAGLDMARSRLDRSINNLLQREAQMLASVRERPVLANPQVMVSSRAEDLERWKQRSTDLLRHRVMRASDEINHLKNQMRALSPQQTLDRGYSVTQLEDGSIVREAAQAPADSKLFIRLASGQLVAKTLESVPAGEHAN